MLLPLLATKSSIDICKLQALATMTNTMPTQITILHGPPDTARQTLGIIALAIGFGMIALVIALYFIQRKQQAQSWQDYQRGTANYYYTVVNDNPSPPKPKPVAVAYRLAPAPGWQPDADIDFSHVEDDLYAARLANFIAEQSSDPEDAELDPDGQLSDDAAEKLRLRVQSYLAQQAVENSTDPWEKTALWRNRTRRNANAIDF